MLTITKATVPTYLRGSLLYNELSDDCDNDPIFNLPIQFCKLDDSIYCQEDLVHLCHSWRYWGVTNLPKSVIEAAFGSLVLDWKPVVAQFSAELMQLDILLKVANKEKNERIHAAVATCWLDLVDYVWKQGCNVPSDIVTTAARLGQREIMEYFVQRGVHADLNTERLAVTAAEGGHLNCLQYAHELGCPWNLRIARSAAHRGYLDCLQYARTHGCPWDSCAISNAAMNGHINCLIYLVENGCSFDNQATLYATQYNHLNCLIYLYEQGCPWYPYCTCYAAKKGYLDILTFLHEHGCPWGEGTTRSAALYGHLDGLMYAHEHGCRWDERTTRYACENGSLACLEYAHEHGCPWAKGTIKEAQKCGYYDCLEYALDHGCTK